MGIILNHKFLISCGQDIEIASCFCRTVSSGISGASYYTGTFNTVNRSPNGNYVAVSSRGNFYLTWEPGQVMLIVLFLSRFLHVYICNLLIGFMSMPAL